MVFKIGVPNGVCVYMGLLLLVVLKKYQLLKNFRGVSTGGLKHCQSKPNKMRGRNLRKIQNRKKL